MSGPLPKAPFAQLPFDFGERAGPALPFAGEMSGPLPRAPFAQLPFDFGERAGPALASFFPGENRALLALIDLIAKDRASHTVYFWGGRAAGKTHLLQAACHESGRHGLRAAYIPLRLQAELSAAILHDLGEIDLVCVDDIHLISGQPAWQQGLVWLYDELRERRHSLLISGPVAPARVNLETEDLKSRLASDQVCQIRPPDDELKGRILRQWATRRSCELTAEALQYLIHRVDRDLSCLIALLDKIDRAALTEKRRITIPFIRAIIEAR